jgi:hypothetical protein
MVAERRVDLRQGAMMPSSSGFQSQWLQPLATAGGGRVGSRDMVQCEESLP